MKAKVFSRGDPSVGIQGGAGSIDTDLEIDDDEREDHRREIAKFFSELWAEQATVLFEDEEFDEYDRIQRKPATALTAQILPQPGHYLLTPRNGGKPFTSTAAPDSWELRECLVQFVPDQCADCGAVHAPGQNTLCDK